MAWLAVGPQVMGCVLFGVKMKDFRTLGDSFHALFT
jgi:hypothetical protein